MEVACWATFGYLTYILRFCFLLSHRGKGRWKDKVISLDPPVGRFKKGVLKLTEPDIKKFH